MYDRYTITASKESIENTFKVKISEDFKPTFNGAPTHQLPIITQQNPKNVSIFQWGFIGGLSNNKSISSKLFNLPASGVFQRKMYQKLLVSNRCIIIADGFYVRKQVSKKQLVPYYFYFPNHSLFAIAGVWEASEDIDGNVTESFNLITIASNPELANYQEDMPAILSSASVSKWLSEDTEEDELIEILDKIEIKNLITHPVSPRINDPNLNDQTLIKPSAPSDQFGNYTLFN